MDGLEMQAWLVDAGIKLPVVFMTGSADVETAVRCMKDGAFDFLRKPIGAPELMEAAATAVSASRKVHCSIESTAYASALLGKLTPTESRVAELISAGLTTKAIAAAMKRSENKIKIHRLRVFEKLSVATAPGGERIIVQTRERVCPATMRMELAN